MKSLKRRNFSIIFCAFVFLLGLEADENKYLPLVVNEFRNVNESGELFYRVRIGEDDRTGNDLVFDPSGKAFIYQWVWNQIYELDSKYQVVKIVLLPENDSRDVRYLVKADGIGFLLFNYYGIESYFDYQGNAIFHTDIYNLMQEPVTTVDYLSNILFLVDRKGRLYSVLNPSMDQGKNHANYRNPEQTVDLFKTDSVVDLKGLSRDDKGRIFRDDVYIGPAFMPVVGKYRYTIDSDSCRISNGFTRIASIEFVLPLDEIHESTAIHPSGDIYILRYNQERNKHILYKIENTWDLDAKNAWNSQKK